MFKTVETHVPWQTLIIFAFASFGMGLEGISLSDVEDEERLN